MTRTQQPAHDVTVRFVPLLTGGWFFRSQCSCGEQTNQRRIDRDEGKRVSITSLACFPAPSRVRYRMETEPAAAQEVVHPHYPPESVTLAPYGSTHPLASTPPDVVCVDASFNVAHRIVGAAAVTGSGWVNLHRTEVGRTFNSCNEAEAMAVLTGLDMLSAGATGTLISDSTAVVEEIHYCLTRNFRCHRPHWLPHDIFDSLAELLTTRRITVRREPRNSSPGLTLADKLAGLAAHEMFDARGMAKLLRWVRTDEASPDWMAVDTILGAAR